MNLFSALVYLRTARCCAARTAARWRIPVVGGAIMAMAALTPTRADVVWVQPESFASTPGAALFVTLAGAPEFGALKSAVTADHVDRVDGRLAGAPLVASGLDGNSAAAARFSFTLPRPGVAVIAADLKPEVREIAAPDVERYFRAIHATDALRENWATFPAGTSWRERHSVRLKTWIRVGIPAASDRAFGEPVDRHPDIIAESDPTTVREDDELTIRLLREGEGVPGVAVSFLARGELREHVVITDENGRAKARLDARGPWLIQATDVRLVRAGTYDWDSSLVAVSFDVK
jgi:hypothetical protein